MHNLRVSSVVLDFSEHKLAECTHSDTIFRNFWMIAHMQLWKYTLGKLDLGEDFKDVEFRDYACGDIFEKLH